MKRWMTLCLVFSMLLQVFFMNAMAEEPKEMTAAEVFEACAAQTVHIETSGGGGSGFFVAESIIATNNHVIENAGWITVKTIDGTIYDVTAILACSGQPDLALIQINGKGQPSSMSRRPLREGDALYCIGAPMGIYPCLSNGIVMKRSHIDNGVDYILANCHSIGGNSGGPVFNSYGEVVGVVVGGMADGPNSIDLLINAKYLKNMDTGNPREIPTKAEWMKEYNKPDEEKYERASLENAKVGQLVSFGAYEQDAVTANGKEDILWIVLDKEGSKLTLLSLYCLDVVPYHQGHEDVTWENSDIRAFLNGEFHDKAFTAAEQKMILQSVVVNDDNVLHGTPGGNDTVDKVYLLSLEEAMAFYGVDTPEERFYDNIYAQATPYTVNKNVWLEIPNSVRCWWWLRSPGGNPRNAAEIGSAGYLSFNGSDVGNRERAVRPVIQINVK